MCTERGQVFDFAEQHPHIAKKSGKVMFKAAATYLKKDGYWGGTITDDEENAGHQPEDIWAMAIVEEDEATFDNIIKAGDPKSYLKSYCSIRQYKQDAFKPKERGYVSRFTMEDFVNVPGVMKDYATYVREGEEMVRPRGLIIVSPSRYGKTQWARAITEDHGYLCTEWNPRKIKEDCKVMIFDDVPMSELLAKNRWKPFFGMQEEFEITGKYTASISIRRQWKGFIFLCNEDPRYEEGVSPGVRNYIDINCDTVHLDMPLFN